MDRGISDQTNKNSFDTLEIELALPIFEPGMTLHLEISMGFDSPDLGPAHIQK